MRKIQFLLLAIAFTILAHQPLMAQQQIDPEARATERKRTLTAQLDLSPEQANKVYDVTLKFWAKVKENREAGLSQAELRKLNKPVNDEFENSLKETLTDEQYAKLQQIRQEVAERQRARRNNQ